MCFVWLLNAAVKCPQQLYCGKMYPLYSYHWSSANDEFGPRAHEEPTWRDCKHRSGSEAQDFCLNQHKFQAELELVDMWSQTYDCTVGEEVGKDHFVSSNIELRERERERHFFLPKFKPKLKRQGSFTVPSMFCWGMNQLWVFSSPMYCEIRHVLHTSAFASDFSSKSPVWTVWWRLHYDFFSFIRECS